MWSGLLATAFLCFIAVAIVLIGSLWSTSTLEEKLEKLTSIWTDRHDSYAAVPPPSHEPAHDHSTPSERFQNSEITVRGALVWAATSTLFLAIVFFFRPIFLLVGLYLLLSAASLFTVTALVLTYVLRRVPASSARNSLHVVSANTKKWLFVLTPSATIAAAFILLWLLCRSIHHSAPTPVQLYYLTTIDSQILCLLLFQLLFHNNQNG